MDRELTLGLLISGGGTTFLNLHRAIQEEGLPARIGCVISSNAKAPGLEHARRLGYPHAVVSRKKFDSDRAFSQAITEKLEAHGTELAVLAGFLRRYLPAERYKERCINIHPALLPAFGGKGFFGMHVHEAVWKRSCKLSGCTVHLVNEEYDAGTIILQKWVVLDHNDTPEDIRRKVFVLECEALPLAIRLFAEGRIEFRDGRSIIKN